MELSQVLFTSICLSNFLYFTSIYSFNEIHNHSIAQNFANSTKTRLTAALSTISYFSVSFFFKTLAIPSKTGNCFKSARNIIA